MKKILTYYKNHKGITIVMIALMLVVLLMFAGLAIDISYMYFVKNQLQVAGDAAALAGAAKLPGNIDDTTLDPNVLHQEAARQEAWKFACKNNAAGTSVYLSTNTPANCNANPPPPPPSYADLNGDNNTDGEDIVVGNWDSNTRIFTRATGSTGLRINALQARPRRTNETPGMPSVGVFIGKVFGWSSMSARASAIAARLPFTVLPITLCTKTCEHNIATPISPTNLLFLQLNPSASPLGCDEYQFMAWTNFNSTNPTDIGRNGDVSQLISGALKPPSDICSKTCPNGILTNNGVGAGGALDALVSAFSNPAYDPKNKTFDSGGNVIAWKVAVPIVNLDCTTGGCGCPPSLQGHPNEPYNVSHIAVIEITSVDQHGNPKGVLIDYMSDCTPCPTSPPLGNDFALVK